MAENTNKMQSQYHIKEINFNQLKSILKPYKSKPVELNEIIFNKFDLSFYNNGNIKKIKFIDKTFTFDNNNKILLKTNIFTKKKRISIKNKQNKVFIFDF